MTPQLTGAGKNLLLRAMTGETVTFTKIQLGNGSAQTADGASALNSPVITLPLTSIKVGNEYVTLSGYFSNAALTNGFRVTEMGIFAKDPDDETKEILYALGNSSSGEADYIPPKTDRIYEVQFDALVFIGDAENVTATINGSLVYASAGDLSDHIGDKNNPHEVTKAQVGLGNVPNVATNDQTPTYTESATLENISSGEKLSAALGKIKKGISALISHIGSKQNPHEVTAAQVGAAAAEHTHSAEDVTSGVLPVARGGTGAETIAALASALVTPLQNAGGLPKVVVGTYTGTGSESSTTVTFSSPPRVFICGPQSHNSTSYQSGCWFTCVRGMQYCVGQQYSDTNGVQLSLDWTGNSISWNIDPEFSNAHTSAGARNNQSGRTYVYAAIL